MSVRSFQNANSSLLFIKALALLPASLAPVGAEAEEPPHTPQRYFLCLCGFDRQPSSPGGTLAQSLSQQTRPPTCPHHPGGAGTGTPWCPGLTRAALNAHARASRPPRPPSWISPLLSETSGSTAKGLSSRTWNPPRQSPTFLHKPDTLLPGPALLRPHSPRSPSGPERGSTAGTPVATSALPQRGSTVLLRPLLAAPLPMLLAEDLLGH